MTAYRFCAVVWHIKYSKILVLKGLYLYGGIVKRRARNKGA